MWTVTIRCALAKCRRLADDMDERGWVRVSIEGNDDSRVTYICCSRLHAAEHFARAISELSD